MTTNVFDTDPTLTHAFNFVDLTIAFGLGVVGTIVLLLALCCVAAIVKKWC